MAGKSFWAKGLTRMGFTEVYVVDEHGCLLNTEPACSFTEWYADWFWAWLSVQPCPYPTEPSLLEHIPSFPQPAEQQRARE